MPEAGYYNFTLAEWKGRENARRQSWISRGRGSLAARLITDCDQPGRSVSELAFYVAKLTIFYKPFTWITVGECILS
jgi:hypothetical protein